MQTDIALSHRQVGISIQMAWNESTTLPPRGSTIPPAAPLSTVLRWGKLQLMAKVMDGTTRHQQAAL